MRAAAKQQSLWIASLKYVARGALGAIGAIFVYLIAIWIIYEYAGDSIAANLLAMRTQPNTIAASSR